MARGERIPLRNELDFSSAHSPALSSGLGDGGMKAILSEIAAMLERLASTGEVAQIDLRSLPLATREYANLKALLGEGEAQIELTLGGLTLCHETAVPAVWWVEHFNNAGSVVAAFIEVAEVPYILRYEADELQLGIARLNRQLEMIGNNKEESDHE